MIMLVIIVLLTSPAHSGFDRLSTLSASEFCVNKETQLFGTDSDQNRTLEEIPRSGADSLPLIKPLMRTRTLCGQTQTQV
jgi:hypothetical protein